MNINLYRLETNEGDKYIIDTEKNLLKTLYDIVQNNIRLGDGGNIKNIYLIMSNIDIVEPIETLNTQYETFQIEFNKIYNTFFGEEMIE